MTLPAAALGQRLVAALEGSGLQVHPESRLNDRPLLLTVDGREESRSFRIFLWNATPGGPPGVRAETEFRVQTTRPGEVAFLVSQDQRQTLLLGYHAELDVFAGWDVRRHPNPRSSSSLQVALDVLQEAASTGFASKRRPLASGEEEVIIAFSPDNARTYLEILPAFQTAVPEASDASLGAAITSGEEPAEADLPEDVERRSAIHTVVIRVRDRRFRRRVINAYSGRCAFCGVGLGLADAAHIHAVRDGGPDMVANGLCACPTHHRAFDRGLILVEDDFTIASNRSLLAKLGFSEDEVKEFENGLLPKLLQSSGQAPATDHIARHRNKWTVVS